MNNKELVNAGHELAKAISNDTPLIEIAKMVSNLATQLDVQIARSHQLSIALEAAEKRTAELEAKKVKIKLPESFYPDGDIDCPLVINEYQIVEAIVAADCKPIAICPRCKCELDLSLKPDGAHYCHADGTAKGE
ncbi:hypothetical protein ACM7SY_03005, partial [Enterobacter hormaechei]